MTTRSLIAAVWMSALVALIGCYEPIRDTRGGWERAAPGWVVKKPGERARERARARTGAVAQDKPATAPSTAFKPDKEIVNPILEAKGNWTVRVWFFYGNPKTKRSALSYANAMAKLLQRKGYHPYVTDQLSQAIVSVGAWESKEDPDLKRVWREMYEGWLEAHRGRKSTFRNSMEQWYTGKTVLGDEPRPISILDLQMKMKGAYGMALTDDEKRRYKEYLENQQRRMYGFDRFGN